MNKNRKELAEALLTIMDRLCELPMADQLEIPEEALLHISYALEHLTGEFGTTEKVVEEHIPGYFKKKDN